MANEGVWYDGMYVWPPAAVIALAFAKEARAFEAKIKAAEKSRINWRA